MTTEQPSVPVILKNAGPCDGPFRSLDYPRMFVLLNDCAQHRAGSILSPNRELSRRSSGGTTHMVLRSAYDGLRAQRAIIRRQHGSLERPHGELQEIRLFEEEVRTFLRFCLLSQMASRSEQDALRRTVESIERTLRSARTAHLASARPQLHRTLQEFDALGRRNPMAAAMVGGAAIGHFAARQKDIARISGFFITHREYVLFQEIERIHHIFDEVERAVSPPSLRHATDTPQDIAARMRNVHYVLSQTGPSRMPTLAVLLRQLAAELDTIDVLPFRKIATLTASDLRGMANLCAFDDENAICAKALLIRWAFRWEKAQRFLELNAITPLSFVLTESAAIRRFARLHGETGDAAVRKFSEPRLHQILKDLRRFRKGIDNCISDGFKIGIKDDVIRYTDTALEYTTKGEWTQALRWLKGASALI